LRPAPPAREDRGVRRAVLIYFAALGCAGLTVLLVLTSDHLDGREVWAVLGPVVGLSFVGTGLYAERRRPESGVGRLMIWLGFAWFVSVIGASNAPLLYTLGLFTGGLWGGVFLQLVLTFPSGRLTPGWDRRLVIAGYLIFTVASLPVALVADSETLDCKGCPRNVLLVERNDTLAGIAYGVVTLLYAALFVIVLVRLVRRWRASPLLERVQLTPVYFSGMGTFLLVTVAMAADVKAALWAAFGATALLPFAFLAGLLRSRLAYLDAELRASRLRIVEAGDTERRRLERNLHDGAQARLVGLAMLIGQARRSDPAEVPVLLDRAAEELSTSLAELRELARGIHPAVLTEKGLDAALYALASRSPVPVNLDTEGSALLPEAVEIAAYYVVTEALTNVAKYARATHADVAVRRLNGHVTVDVADDGIGGADVATGSGLRGLADRIAALDGTLSLESPPGRGTRVHVEMPTTGSWSRSSEPRPQRS
jgi:signal transduction histidine kinase